MVQAWEYYVETFNLAERWSSKRAQQEAAAFSQRLNVLGAEGWELVSQEQIALVGGITGNVKGQVNLLFFKRPAGV